MVFPMNNTHKLLIVNHRLYMVYLTSHIHIKMLLHINIQIVSTLTAQTRYPKTKDCLLIHDVHNLHS